MLGSVFKINADVELSIVVALVNTTLLGDETAGKGYELKE